MRAVREQKVPEMQDLRQRRGAGAQGQHGRERIQLGLHALVKEIGGELGLDNLEAAVDEAQAAVHAVHGAAHVAGALAGDEVVEEGEGLDLAAGGVEEGRAQHVHALDVDGGFAHVGAGAALARAGLVDEGLVFCDSGRRVDEAVLVAFVRGRAVREGRGCLCIVQFPGDRVEEPDQACFCDAALEERVCGQRAEGVVADLGVGWGAAAVDEGEVVVCWDGRDV